MTSVTTPANHFEPLAFDLQLPWVADEQREAKFRRHAIRAIIAVAILFIIVQFLPVFTIAIDEPDIIKTTLILEPKVSPKPPKPITETPKPKIKPVKRLSTVKENKPAPAAKPKKKTSTVTSLGLDSLSTQLASLSGSVDMQKLRKKNVTSSDRGKVAEISEEFLGENRITQRSAGVEISDEIMRADVAQLSAHTTTEVEGLDFNSGILSNSDSYGELPTGKRNMENIRRPLEAVKSRLYVIYQRERATKPDLAGKFIFKLIIEPNGTISKLRLLSSELGIATLEEEFLDNIRLVHFGQDDVIATTVNYTFIFLPS